MRRAPKTCSTAPIERLSATMSDPPPPPAKPTTGSEEVSGANALHAPDSDSQLRRAEKAYHLKWDPDLRAFTLEDKHPLWQVRPWIK